MSLLLDSIPFAWAILLLERRATPGLYTVDLVNAAPASPSSVVRERMRTNDIIGGIYNARGISINNKRDDDNNIIATA
eukprot:scaffold60070_cov35-Attheya_sp.AAC.1